MTTTGSLNPSPPSPAVAVGPSATGANALVPVAVSPDTIQEGFACILQARLSWPQADACAADLVDYLRRQGFVVTRQSTPTAQQRTDAGSGPA